MMDEASPLVHPSAVLGGARVGPGTRIGAGVVFDTEGGPPHIGKQVSIGANATLAGGVRVGDGARVAPGAVVLRDVPPYAMVAGNPAVIEGYVDAGRATDARPADPAPGSRVRGVMVADLPRHVDLRGALVAAEFERHLPFVPRRAFLVYAVPNREVRGEHAHRACHQYLLCISGSCAVVVDDGEQREEVLLDRPERGLYLPPLIWGIQYRYTADAVLLVLASHPYDPDDYIRSYDEFRQIVARG